MLANETGLDCSSDALLFFCFYCFQIFIWEMLKMSVCVCVLFYANIWSYEIMGM